MAYEDENPYAGYDPSGVTPQELYARLANLQTRIAATISRVDREGNELRQRQAQLKIEIDEVSISVSDVRQTVEGEVTRLDASLSVMAGEISQRVTYTDYNGNTISSLINQTATTIKIQAARIEFYGQVFGEGAVFSGDLVGGRILSNTSINVTTDLYVGNDVYLGVQSPGIGKKIHFNESTWIGGNNHYIQAESLEFHVEGYLYVRGNEVATQNYVNNNFAYASHSHYGTYCSVFGSNNVGFEITSNGNLNIYRNNAYFKTITL